MPNASNVDMAESNLRHHSLDTVWLNTFLPQNETEELQSDANISKLQSEYEQIASQFSLFLAEFNKK